MTTFAAVVVFDDPECGGAAEAFAVLSKSLPSMPSNGAGAEVVMVPAGTAKSHGDALLDALRGLVNFRASELVVFAFLKDAQASAACSRIREICADAKIAECHVATHLASFGDVGLVVRNLVRRFHEVMSRTAAPAPSAS